MARPTDNAITHGLLREQGKKILELSVDVSTMKNEVDDIKKLLHSNSSTNQKGAIELLDVVNDRVYALEEFNKISVAKKGLLISVGLFLGGGLVTLIKWLFIK